MILTEYFSYKIIWPFIYIYLFILNVKLVISVNFTLTNHNLQNCAKAFQSNVIFG